MIASFNRFEISLTRAQAAAASHQGDCGDDVKALLSLPTITRQLNKINPDDIRAELKEYGAWDEEERNDDTANRMRILWIAAGNINNEIIERKKHHESHNRN